MIATEQWMTCKQNKEIFNTLAYLNIHVGHIGEVHIET